MSAARKYEPERGDVIWLEFTPQAGHEQAGHRPALVISPKTYNAKTGLAMVCPITSQVKGYPFEVALGGASKIKGVVLTDQLRSLDWRARKAQFVERSADSVLNEVVAKVLTLIET